MVALSSFAAGEIMRTIGARDPESGGILLGPIGRPEVTDFYFDPKGTCTGATYTPHHQSLRRMMREEWMPAGIDLKGFVHSHPRGARSLSPGDLSYIGRLLRANPDMDRFVAPVVFPHEFRMQVFVVLAEAPRTPLTARLHLIEIQGN